MVITSYSIAKNKIEVEKQDIEKIDRVAKIEKIISLLRGVQDEFDLDELASKKGFDPLQRIIINHFSKLYGFIEAKQLLDELSFVSQKNDSRELNRLVLAAGFVVLPEDDIYKMMVYKYFKQGTKYNSNEILKRWNTLFIEANLNSRIETTAKAVRQLKVHFNCKRNNDGSYTILSDNPFDFIVINRNNSVTEKILI